jgi:hypothetical protein
MIWKFVDFREKKREKERDELWKRLGELELSYQNANNVGNLNSSNPETNAISTSSELLNSSSK